MAELFGENMSQVSMLMMILDSFPGQKDGIRVPIHPKSRQAWAQELIDKGVVLDPDRMTRFPIPGDHPEAGWLNPSRWVSREEYEKYAAMRPDGNEAEAMMRQMLQAINPAMAQRISSMTDAEKLAAKQENAPEMQDLFERMQQIGRAHWEQNSGGEKT